jgi:hypothetical protein
MPRHRLVVKDGGTVFEPARLELIRELTQRLEEMPNVRSERVASLATESSIAGRDGAVEVEPYIPAGRITEVHGGGQRRGASPRMGPHQDGLASADGRAAIIMAELEDATRASESYEAALAMAQEYARDGLELHVAGPGAVSGFLSTYIDRDARKMQPMVFALVILFIYLAFRSRVRDARTAAGRRGRDRRRHGHHGLGRHSLLRDHQRPARGAGGGVRRGLDPHPDGLLPASGPASGGGRHAISSSTPWWTCGAPSP